MKPKHVHRGLTNKSPALTERDTSTAGVGKIQRIHRTFQDGQRRSRRSPRDKGAYFRNNLSFFFLIVAAAFIGGVTWMLYQQMKSKDGRKDVSTLAQDTFTVPHPPGPICVNMVKQFLDAANTEDLKKIARTKRIKPENAYAVFTEFRKELGEVDRMEWMGAEETNGMSMERVMVVYRSGKYRVATLIHDGLGQWKVDLESFMGHQTKSWDQITAQTGCTAVVRVTVQQDVYFNGYFSDEKEWVCFALKAPDQSEPIYGYVPQNSPTLLDMVEILRTNSPADMMVEIIRDAGMNRMQYEIHKVIAQGWVEADVPFSERRLKKNATNPAP
jgi:hypothetical protein